jgi:hypothetical protein
MADRLIIQVAPWWTSGHGDITPGHFAIGVTTSTGSVYAGFGPVGNSDGQLKLPFTNFGLGGFYAQGQFDVERVPIGVTVTVHKIIFGSFVRCHRKSVNRRALLRHDG